jgi:hypothetical protein
VLLSLFICLYFHVCLVILFGCFIQGGPKGGSNEDLDVRLLIHQSRAGCVIGKAGAKIKELREVSSIYNCNSFPR